MTASLAPSLVRAGLGYFRRRPAAVAGLALLLPLALFAAWPGLFDFGASAEAIDVGQALQPPSPEHWFGTDEVGRDVFARIVHGARVTLGTVAGALALATISGGLIGLFAGHIGGWPDLACGRLADSVQSFPPIALGVVIAGVLGASIGNLWLALTVVYLPQFFRAARAASLHESTKPYVEAARAIGVGPLGVIRRHIGPNVAPAMVVQYMVLFPLALQIEAALGFLGLGVPPPVPDWGAIMDQGKNYLLSAPWLCLFPGLFIAGACLGTILLGRELGRR